MAALCEEPFMSVNVSEDSDSEDPIRAFGLPNVQAPADESPDLLTHPLCLPAPNEGVQFARSFFTKEVLNKDKWSPHRENVKRIQGPEKVV